MALYRNIQMAFWTDTSVSDDYTSDDRLMYLYVLTNPHTNLCGCYEISVSQISNETGFDRKKVGRLLDRAEHVHKTIVYSQESKELLILRWSKYNWTSSDKFRKPLLKEIEAVKCQVFKDYLMDLYLGNDNPIYRIDTVCSESEYGIDTTVTDTVTVSDTVTDTVSDSKPFKVIKNIYYPNDEKLNQAFQDFIEMRRMIKAPMTERAITIAMNKLSELAGNDNDLAIQIIDEAIEHNWKSFYPLKDERKKRSPTQEWEEA